MTKEEILHKITEYAELYPFAQVIPISALKGDNAMPSSTNCARSCRKGPSISLTT